MRILLTVSYDGSAYAGWQRQDNAPTVQETLERALSEVFCADSGINGELSVAANGRGRNPGPSTAVAHSPALERALSEVFCADGGTNGDLAAHSSAESSFLRLTGASRTDAGVHALGQKAAFSVPESKIPLDKLPYVINNALPPDIVVTDAREVPDSFHPRFDAKEKTYRYLYHSAQFPNPMVRDAWFCPYELDVEKMDNAAKDFIGAHDFAAFCAAGSAAKTTTREIYGCRVEPVDPNAGLIALFVRGNGFLYNMVRIMAGTLCYVGRGKLPPDCVPGIIQGKDRAKAGITAPARGLTLMEVIYSFDGR